ncbi:MAG: STAS domain-containing protein [Ferruginibacter sp.]
MNVKTDTKEKFTVIMPEDPNLSANMTEELKDLLLAYQQKGIPHIVLKMNKVETIDENIAELLADLQQQFYENDVSFVICELQDKVEKLLDEKELLEVMNVTPTESEAWDILQMEEVERELLADDDDDDIEE